MKNKSEIIIGHKYTNFADKYSKEDLLMALTLALSSKFIPAKEVGKAVDRIINSKRILKNAFKLSESFLVFVTKSFSKTK
ncbi:MAG: hypothetical protein UU10_C0004G0002 [Parcubacteria group bacterium GW2011_GWF1_40_6]|uniref:Uncharacterized protein n=2 Tax=Candidatus Nomuraibacteriota TaxID=1752729 RepID=A0A0G0QSH9_9BACT|nr:MAG: hypothetical protein UT78_C0004G0004 [Candidatus Nomurabacteria bacterium GW2011_GWF2_40_12]KKR69831.1 MAG: hypothetical protein UU10_C0004G0002 [Parcubacteria group bacterium GW2011_GWF1_40_6]OGJ09435.1 MAG: hypothetical protein A2356_01130 [Candidatus Nomurabacteria bacterium RIFOXYB1_FULL_39_16]OGJ14796.1 MAG: hypothetical protein A2585_03965 [Candidatus Nomurabacteria bacterium RIFOXYD1_FULL_39_12]